MIMTHLSRCLNNLTARQESPILLPLCDLPPPSGAPWRRGFGKGGTEGGSRPTRFFFYVIFPWSGPMAAYGYIRVSTQEQASGTSLEEQRRRIEGIALMRGDALEHVYGDAGVSGSVTLENRPAGRELCARLARGDVLIVAKLDRAFRSAADALARADKWRAAGVHLIVADMGSEPVTGNGVSKMFFGMLALVADFERERLLERTRDGKTSKRARGGHIGGRAPFGYRVEGTGKEARLVQVAEQQAAIQTIRENQALISLRALSHLVAERHGIQISHEAVRRILRSAGVAPANWEAAPSQIMM